MIWRFTLTAGVNTYILEGEPIGWADTVMNFRRDPNWHGVFTEYAVNLQFYGQGYDLLKEVYSDLGINAYVGITIEYSCDPAPTSYDLFFEGKLLMAKLIFDCDDDCIASVPIEPSGCFMKFMNRMDQAVDLDAPKDLDGGSLPAYTYLPFILTVEPKSIVYQSIGGVTGVPVDSSWQGPTPAGTVTSGTGSEYHEDYQYVSLPSYDYSLMEIDNTGSPPLQWADDDPSNLPIVLHAVNAGKYCFVINYCVHLESWVVTDANLDSGQQIDVQVVFWKNGSTVVHSQGYLSDSTFYSADDNHSSYDFVVHEEVCFDLNAGDEITIGLEIHMQGNWNRDLLDSHDIAWANYIRYDCATMQIKAFTQFPATESYAYMINEALSRTIEGVTGNCMKLYSEYFSRFDSQPYTTPFLTPVTTPTAVCGAHEVIMKGLHLRGFPNVHFAVSFKDLFESLNGIHNLGWGIEPNFVAADGSSWVRVEPMEYFYDSANILLLCDNVPKIVRKVAADMYVSTIEVGYLKWEAEKTSGLDEFNTRRKFRTTLSEVKKDIDLKSKFMASGYAIEVTRRQQYTDDTTQDYRWDNETFIICVQSHTVGPVLVEQGIDCATGVTGVLDPDTMYNYRISPIRNLLRWAKAIMASYFPDINSGTAELKFMDGDGNFVAAGNLNNGCFQEDPGVALSEKGSISTSSFDDPDQATPLFKYEYVEYEYPLSLEDMVNIRANPRGKIGFRHFDTQAWEYGYISKLEYRPNDGKAIFTLLPEYI